MPTQQSQSMESIEEHSSLHEFRLQHLRTSLCQALRSPFYSKKLSGWSENELRQADFHMLSQLPFTNKQMLREAGLDILAVPIQQTVRYYESSGTTGIPTPTPKTKGDIERNTKGLLLNWRKILKSKEDIALLMLPSDLAPVADAMVYGLEAMDVLSVRAFPFTRGVSGWDQIIRVMDWIDVNVLFCTPGLAIYLYNELKKRSIQPSEVGIRKIMLLGELVTDAMRQMLEHIWRADVFINSYGSSEIGTCATSCPHKQLHLLTHMYHFEWLDTETGHTAKRAEGELVVTTLTAEARPLIRYRTGDYVRIKQTSCTCGLPTPTVEVMGRIGENVVVSGKKLSPYDIEQLVFKKEGVIGYCLREVDAEYVLCLEVETAFQEKQEAVRKIEEEVRRELQGKGYDMKVEAVFEFNEMTKRGGGFKNWKLTHIVKN